MLNQEQLAFLAEILPCWKAMDREHQRLLAGQLLSVRILRHQKYQF